MTMSHARDVLPGSARAVLPDTLRVRGARVHNLRGVDLDVPHRALVVFTGVSGSGKSSLAFDTIYAEAQRRQVQSMSSFARQFLGEMSRPDVDQVEGLCSAVAVDQRSSASRSPRSTVGTVTEVYDLMRVLWGRVGVPHCPRCGEGLGRGDRGWACPAGHEVGSVEVAGRAFSFNLPFGQCPDCAGVGVVLAGDEGLVVPDLELSVVEGAVAPWRERSAAGCREAAVAVVSGWGVRPEAPWRSLPPGLREVLLRGREVAVPGRSEVFTGVLPWLAERQRAAAGGSFPGQVFLRPVPCSSCGGGRLRAEQRAVRVGGRGITEVSALPVTGCREFFAGLELAERERVLVEQAVEEILERLSRLVEVGLGYLTLDRPARTLSTGEAQRVRLAGQVGTRLFGLLYVLDEPTAGLHPQDVEELVGTLRALRDRGNSVVVVEHDARVIEAADWVVELGPAAGEHGGRLLFSGPVEALRSSEESVTGGYLAGRWGRGLPERRRASEPGRELVVRGAVEHNLGGVDVAFPLGCVVAVSGVSGAGKSTLVDQILYRVIDRALGGDAPPPGAHERVEGVELVDRVIRVDQSPIGRSARSTPATYTGVLDAVRTLFARTERARRCGFTPGRFSFNSPGGRCEECSGEGVVRVEMHFLPDVFLPCAECGGSRYDAETLSVTYRGRTIAEVLAMTVEEAAEFFREDPPAVRGPLRVLCEVGLGYLRLGQAGTTLSGGEAQRVKLAAELHRRAGRHTVYVLDEPTTGLHARDVERLVGVLHRLVDRGHTAVVVSHSMDVVRAADWVIDLGPGGGRDGGRVVAVGTPEEVAAGRGHTARHLRRALGKDGVSGEIGVR
ncbi:excinuclease ABC subunit UvrA [Actinoalloteichus caeruleus]|uniref:excinuclease ABC subunit UvrA n=2 Tax=Actinoalloteichus cyanogriseus TaxID=2893586 RepID=UPI000A85B10E|nr:excinuclease ABC subunit UvrA [Actinoalloteichus caeruleus]